MLKKPETFPLAAEAEQGLDRRRFLHTAAGAAILAVAGEWLAARLEAKAVSRQLEVHLADAEALQIGEARALADAERNEVLVVRVDATTLVGFDRRCPHLGCPVLWVAERGRFECPCHAAAFDARTGAVLFGPPRRGLDPAAVQVAATSHAAEIS